MSISKISFQNSCLELPERFYQKVLPQKVPNPSIKSWNVELAQFLGISATIDNDKNFLEQVFSGKQIVPESQPLAMAYSGHQFGHFNPEMGDGRAHLLGELMGKDGKSYDIQLKGSGQTRYSRRGDGLAALGPVVREYLVSEAMHSLGVPTTRSLAVVETGQTVYRGESLKGGILTRVAESHIRVGHFERFAYIDDVEGLQKLVEYTIQKSYPELKEAYDKPLAMFGSIIRRQAILVSQWMSLGFVHGVMNTDNTSASGITIDYGPCAFLDETDFNKVFSSIDRSGRYAYNKQPHIQQWNLARLADALLKLYKKSELQLKIKEYEGLLEDYIHIFDNNWRILLLKKIGINKGNCNDEDVKILGLWLEYFIQEKIDFTLGFRELSALLTSSAPPLVFKKIENYSSLISQWKQLITKYASIKEIQDSMYSVNPQIIPRNHVIESIIKSCYAGDWNKFYRFEKELKNPYASNEGKEEFIRPPKPDEVISCTFCGT